MRRSYNDRYARSFLDDQGEERIFPREISQRHESVFVRHWKSRHSHRKITRQNGPQESNRIVGEFVSTLLRVLKINRSRSIDRLYFPRDHPLFSIFFFSLFLSFFPLYSLAHLRCPRYVQIRKITRRNYREKLSFSKLCLVFDSMLFLSGTQKSHFILMFRGIIFDVFIFCSDWTRRSIIRNRRSISEFFYFSLEQSKI